MATYNTPPKKYTEKQCESFEYRLETHFQGYVRDRLKVIPEIWYYHGSDNKMSGIPDCLLSVDGYFIAIELKVGKNTASALQKQQITSINDSGAHAAVAYTWGQFKKEVDYGLMAVGEEPFKWEKYI